MSATGGDHGRRSTSGQSFATKIQWFAIAIPISVRKRDG